MNHLTNQQIAVGLGVLAIPTAVYVTDQVINYSISQIACKVFEEWVKVGQTLEGIEFAPIYS